MKQRLFLILLLIFVTLSGVAQTVGEAFYIYRNDGQFNAFFRDEVISIDYLYEDADGNTYDEIVTQVVNTADSVYMIPLAVIDSIGFVQPETVVNSDVFPLTAEHSPYISNVDELDFTMSTTTPEALLPKVGNIVVATAECTAFPHGIIARVESVTTTGSGYRYICSQAYIDEVFDQLIVYQSTFEGNEQDAPSYALTRASMTANLWNVSWTSTIEARGTTTTLSVGDRAMASITVRKTLTTPFYFQMQLENNMTTSVGFNAQSTASISKEVQIGKTITAGKITIPYSMGLLWLEPKLSLFGYFEEQGNVELNYSGYFNRTDKVVFTYSQHQWDFNHAPMTDVGTDVASLSMEGSAEIGLKPQIDFSLNGQQAGFGLSARAGLKEYINFVFDVTRLSDGSLYDAMRDSYCRTTIPWSVTVHANANIFSRYDANQSDDGLATFSHTFAPAKEPQWGEDRYIFPLFADVKSQRQDNGNTVAVASATVSRTPLLPVQVGFSLLDKDNNILQTQYDTRSYNVGSLFNNYSYTFSNIQAGNKYIIRPSVKLFGYDVLASPAVEIGSGETACPNNNHPHWIDLGLPSGTKWRCCNEGASSPEGYGGYYTFEQAQAYNPPSLEQINELVGKRSYTRTTQNGVAGGKFTGPNGGTIFLPAAGGRWYGEFWDVGSFGLYWSSSLRGEFDASVLIFDSSRADWHSNDRRDGEQSVRPVR